MTYSPHAALTLLIGTAVMLGGCQRDTPPLPCSKACSADDDCDCGVDRGTGLPAVGRKECIDSSRQDPDGCTGIRGNLRTLCISGKCRKTAPCSKTCREDADCVCGIDWNTRRCAVGRQACVEPNPQCTSFCGKTFGQPPIVCRGGRCQPPRR